MEAAALAKESEDKQTQAEHSLKLAVDAEAEWWEWYSSTKKDMEEEAKLREEQEKKAEMERWLGRDR